MPVPSRRAVITGAGAGAAALLFGCGDAGTKPGPGAPGSGGRAGTGGTPMGTGGQPGTGGAPGSGGAAAPGTGGTPGSGGSAADAGGSGGSMGATDVGTPAVDGGGMTDPSEVPSPPAQAVKCSKRNEQIVGPFPASSVQLNRSDIRSDPADNNLVKPGVPLRLVFRVGQGTGAACKAMQNAVVNVWQCDARGDYSNYGSQAGKKYLRGFQVTDGSGVAEFLTIYPGGYSGRSVHLHFSVRMSPTVSFPSGGFVSQLYFPEAINDEVLAQAPYNKNRTRNANDGFYQSIMESKPVKSGKGWLVEFDLAV